MPVCRRCGAENQGDARFCHACGAPLEASATAGQEERKLVSVLFVDLVGSTARADRADPEDVRDELRLFYERVREQIDLFGGVVEKFIGDAVVAVFGAPLAHGDDAERAVRCGLRVLEAIQELNAERDDLDLAIRAAVNTGEAVVTLGAAHERGEALVTGDVVNTASRLQSSAPPGGLVVGAETYRATRRSVRYETLEPVEAKGKREPVEAWLAVGPVGAVGQDGFPLVTSPLVGRDREIEAMASIWDRVTADRRPHLITVVGPPGIGKSRLVAEFVARVTDGGGRCIRGRCLPYEEQTGYRASAEQVKVVAGILETDPPKVARAKLTSAVVDLFPREEADDVGRYLSLLLGLGVDEPTDDRLLLFFAVRRLAEVLGASVPTVLAFEDIHWADPGQLDLLEHLASHLRDVPVVLLALARPELMDVRPSWGGGLLAQTTIPLEPLSAGDASRFASELLGPAPTSEVDLERLVEVAGGNPLFVEELAASIAEGAGEAGSLPTTVREAIAARIDILPAEQRSALLDASVIGKRFWSGVLGAIGGNGSLGSSLDALEARDMIRRLPRSQVEGDVEYSFKHMLIREVAYGTLPRAVRRERHAAIARYIETQAPDNVRDLAAILAHHCREAGESVKAVEYLLLAAERAKESWAEQAAIGLFDEALELVADEDVDLRTRIRLRRAMGIVELSEFEAGAAQLEELLPELSGEDAFEAMLALFYCSTWLERDDTAMRSARVIELAERSDAPELLGPALTTRLGVTVLTGDLDEGEQVIGQTLAAWVPGTRPKDLAWFQEFRMEVDYWVGDYATAEAVARSAHELGGELHHVEPLIRGGGWLGLSLAAMGRTEEAIELNDLIVARAADLDEPRWGAAPLNYSSLAFRDLFLLDEARRRNEAALDLVTKHGEWGMPRMQGAIDLLFTDLMQGDVGRVQREWPVLWDAALNGKAWRPWLGGCRLALVRAELARAAEGPEATVEHAHEAIERAGRAHRPKYEAAARALLGEGLVALGRADEGIGELRVATETADRLGSPTARWQMRGTLGRALAATGDDDGATTALAEARRVIETWTATLTPEHARSFLGAEPVRAVLGSGG